MELGSGSGHLGYIEYFLSGGSVFFDFNPMYVYEFYHPPLFHLLAAAIVRCGLILGVEYVQAFENLQYMTFLFSVMTLWLFFRIFQELGLKGKGLTGAVCVTAFHPALYLLAGSINNDGLCLMFMAAAVLCALRWHREPTVKNIILLSLFIILGALTKTNALLTSPAIAFLMLDVLVRNWKIPDVRRKIVRQLFLFGAVTIPLGLSWLICSYIRYGMPFDFTPAALTVGSTQDISGFTVFQRFFGLKDGPLEKLSLQIHSDHKDYNIIIALLKTSVLEEYKLMSWGVEFYGLCLLMAVNAVLAALSFLTLVRLAVNPGKRKIQKLFVIILYMVHMIFYLRFCFEYPKVCSMDFRYITMTVMTGGAALGWYVQEGKKKSAVYILQGVIFCWACLSVLTYAGLGMTPRAW